MTNVWAPRRTRLAIFVCLTAMGAFVGTLTASGIVQRTLRFEPPEEWIAEEVDSQIRLAQFVLPKAAGDVEDASLVIFGVVGGTVQANLDRWTNQMIQPDGRPSSEVATTTSFLVGDLPITMLDVPGTFSAEVRPGSGMRYHKPRFRLKAAVVETPSGPYFFKLTGPNRTVEQWGNKFVALLESVHFE